MFGLFKKGSHDEDSVIIKRALGPDVVVILSASCCMQGTADIDTQVEASARAALEAANLDWTLLTVTVTQAQNTLGRVSGELDDTQGALAGQVSELFLSHGLSAFPVLIVNQRLVSYGGAPDQELVRKALPSSQDAVPRQVAHEDIA